MPGSFPALSHASAEAKPAGMDEAVQTYNTRSSQNQAFPRTHDEVLRFFDGFELVEPGLVGCAANPDINEVPFAGVAVKP